MTRFRVVTGPPDLSTEGSWLLRGAPLGTPSAGGVVHLVDQSDKSWPSVRPHFLYIGAPARIEAGGSFSKGDPLATDGNGHAVAATTGDIIVGRALEGSSGVDDVAWIVAGAPRLK